MDGEIQLDLIDPDPNQPRQYFEQAGLEELAQSMEANGLAVPILLRPVGDRYTIVHGERRYKAALSLGWDTIPAQIRDLDPEEARWLSLVENVQRADLSPIEEAREYQQRLDEGLTQQQLAERIGKGRTYVTQKIRLLSLPEPLQFFLDRGAISEGHARQLLRLKAIYGEELRADFTPQDPEKYNEDLKMIGSKGDYLFGLIQAIRPEEYTLMAGKLITQADLGIYGEAGQRFIQWVNANDYQPPQWAVAAFWWAFMAAYQEISVALLSKMLGAWEERFYSALVWQWTFRDREPQYKTDRLIYWGSWGDLRHSSALKLDPFEWANRLPELLGRFFEGGLILPSNLQPWGPSHDTYMEMKAKQNNYDD